MFNIIPLYICPNCRSAELVAMVETDLRQTAGGMWIPNNFDGALDQDQFLGARQANRAIQCNGCGATHHDMNELMLIQSVGMTVEINHVDDLHFHQVEMYSNLHRMSQALEKWSNWRSVENLFLMVPDNDAEHGIRLFEVFDDGDRPYKTRELAIEIDAKNIASATKARNFIKLAVATMSPDRIETWNAANFNTVLVNDLKNKTGYFSGNSTDQHPLDLLK